eukprot:5375113-Pyramimonas_sp.AAC.1
MECRIQRGRITWLGGTNPTGQTPHRRSTPRSGGAGDAPLAPSGTRAAASPVQSSQSVSQSVGQAVRNLRGSCSSHVDMMVPKQRRWLEDHPLSLGRENFHIGENTELSNDKMANTRRSTLQ